jgi:type IV fimbrial biogenesis protein FimT
VSDNLPLRQPGFTLIEVLMVIVIMGVVLSLAAPSFRTYMASQKVKTASFDLYATLVFARSEALKRRTLVTVTPSGGNWAAGWTVSADVGGTPTTLRSQDALTGVVTSGATSVAYRLDGRLNGGSTLGVLITPETANPTIQNLCVRIDLTGLPRTTNISNSVCP